MLISSSHYKIKNMRFFYTLSILILISLASNIKKANAQDKLSKFRNQYSITYKFGLANGKETRTLAKYCNTIQLERSFALNNLLSVSLVLSYSHLGGTSFILALTLAINTALHVESLVIYV